jgi:cytochrome c oxidase subunit 2
VNIPSNIITLLAGIIITLASLWFGQNHGLMPVAASAEASQVDDLFNLMMTIATGLFLIVEGVLVYSLLKFRRRPGDQTDGPAMEGNVPLEIFWTAIPTIIVFLLALFSFEIYNNMGGLDPMVASSSGFNMAHHHNDSGDMVAMDKNSTVALGLGASPGQEGEEPLVINVNGIQYAWIFTYADSGIVSGEIHVPINQEVRLAMTAGDVIHAFWLPEFRIKQDVMPGQETILTFTPTLEGSYPIICAELCGAYHGGMKTMLYVESQDEYDQWVQSNTFADKGDLDKAVAVANTATMDEQTYLQPYGEELGISDQTLNAMHHHSM